MCVHDGKSKDREGGGLVMQRNSTGEVAPQETDHLPLP